MGAETAIVKDLEVYASDLGARLFRNNSGSLPDQNSGRWVTFGVGNPPGGGCDLIGWRPLIITPDMVGQTVAQFVGAECKTVKGRAEKNQKDFIALVNRVGGLAGVTRTRLDLYTLLKG